MPWRLGCGLTLLARDFDRFALAFDNVIRGALTPADLAEVRFSDGPLAPADFDLATAMSLERAGPWGAAFPEPIFEGAFDVQDVRIVGGDHVRLRLAPSPGLPCSTPLPSAGVQRGWHQPASRVHGGVLYRLEVNRWRGRETVQLGVECALQAGPDSRILDQGAPSAAWSGREGPGGRSRVRLSKAP